MSKAVKLFFSLAALAGIAAAIIAIMGRKQPEENAECEDVRILTFNEDNELIGVGLLSSDNCNN